MSEIRIRLSRTVGALRVGLSTQLVGSAPSRANSAYAPTFLATSSTLMSDAFAAFCRVSRVMVSVLPMSSDGFPQPQLMHIAGSFVFGRRLATPEHGLPAPAGCPRQGDRATRTYPGELASKRRSAEEEELPPAGEFPADAAVIQMVRPRSAGRAVFSGVLNE